MIKKNSIITVILIISSVINAQDISVYLKQVSENNPEILAYKKLLEARRYEAKTGLAPSDPYISFGHMPGKGASTGTKKIWSVSQSFSFPTKYLIQNRISRSNILLAELEFDQVKLMTLLDAEITMFDLIFNEKRLEVLNDRKKDYDNLHAAWEKMIKYGEASVLDYNKISMELSSLNLLIIRTKSENTALRNRLLFVNGNTSSLPEKIDYPLVDEPDPEILISEKTAYHPAFIIPEKEYYLVSEEAKLSKTGSLPEFQIGYGSESTPGETYSGPVAGLSIPLWSNSNRVKMASAMVDHSAAMRDAELLRLKSEVLNEYLNMKAIKKSMMEISDILVTIENKKYLDIALINGEISLTTYFSDIAVMYQIEDRYIELENEYNKSLALLLDYKILE